MGSIWGRDKPTPLQNRRSARRPNSGAARSYIRIYAFEQCARQDSNLRSRLRSPLSGMAVTSGNVILGVAAVVIPVARYG